MSDNPDPNRLKALDERIGALKKAQEPEPRIDEHYSTANMAWRMVIELVVGLAIGFGIGYGLDLLFGTTPILMVLFILLGFAAGVKTMLRTAREIQEEQVAKAAKETKD
ncbi:AtpZ/AtpI family protein [Cochlodiniinecator piscidefendens]|uniref:AtpZ/AtpI family protein n=1 Tax=Cochlodiniinecator piscidefendens TaxID=2715756 RepID=UPI00140C0A46|nr:AtpZ/AtpI family protein [Cochlodiniinecator piscidefendens]